MPRQKPGRSKQDYATPQAFIDAVERRWGPLTWDLAAETTTAKAPGWFTKEEDAFKQDWTVTRLGDHLWLNPPFGQIAKWARMCVEARMCATAGRRWEWRLELLVPASVGADWFATHVYPYADVLALHGRLSFDGKASFPKDCMLCRYTSDSGDFFDVWDWRKT